MLLRILDRLEEILIASLMGAATVLIFIAVVHRYSSGVPFRFLSGLFPFAMSQSSGIPLPLQSLEAEITSWRTMDIVSLSIFATAK